MTFSDISSNMTNSLDSLSDEDFFERLKCYFSPKQIESMRSSHASYNIWEGSIRSGKTYASLWRFVWEAKHGPIGDFAIVCRTYDSFQRNILPILAEILGVNQKYLRGNRQIYLKKRLCHVITADDASAEAKIRGCTLAGAYVDEITIIPENVFYMLLGRLSIKGSKLFGTTNPDSPFHWCKKWIDNNEYVKSFKFHIDDNPFIDDDKKKELKAQYKGMWYLRFIEGKWVQAEGAIYDCFDEKIHVIDSPDHHAIYHICGVDYGTTNPCAFVLIGVNPSYYPNMWVQDEFYYDSRVRQAQKTDSEYADDLTRFIENRNVKAIYLDPSAASFKIELQRRGIDLVVDANNDVRNGIAFVTQKLWEGAIKITRQCKNLIGEFHSYVWDDQAALKGKERPKKENDHALDALRYALFTHFFLDDGKTDGARRLDQLWGETRGIKPELPAFFQQPNDGPNPHFPRL